MMKAALLLGGNMGNVPETFEKATALIAARCGQVIAFSSVTVTEPWGEFDEGDSPRPFHNQALVVETILQPGELLQELLAIEKQLGRIRDCAKDKYRSRTLDIDIIIYGERIIDLPDLKIPHPLMHTRGFVLEPLSEIVPYAVHPVLKKTILQLLKDLQNEN